MPRFNRENPELSRRTSVTVNETNFILAPETSGTGTTTSGTGTTTSDEIYNAAQASITRDRRNRNIGNFTNVLGDSVGLAGGIANLFFSEQLREPTELLANIQRSRAYGQAFRSARTERNNALARSVSRGFGTSFAALSVGATAGQDLYERREIARREGEIDRIRAEQQRVSAILSLFDSAISLGASSVTAGFGLSV